MPQFERFIENLIEMRLHYRAQIQKYDLAVAQAQDSLSHLNALLVDETHNNQQFIQTLIQMRSHYQNLVDESHRHSASAKSQLNHINALLAEQLVVQHGEHQAISMQARTVEERQTIAEASAIQHQQLPQVVTEPSLMEESNLDSVSPENIDLGINQDSLVNAPTLEEAIVQSKTEPRENVPQLEPNQTQAPSTKVKKQLKTPLLPQYEHLSKSEAVEKLLQDDIGHILHIEYIIRSLYGELDPESVKAEKTRLYDTLLKGVEKGLWDKVPDQPGCYTIDLKLVELETDVEKPNSRQQNKSKSDLTSLVLPQYQNSNFTQAVEAVLREHAGQPMNSEKIAQVLFNEVEEDVFAAAKNKIGKVLWSGANQGRWQGIPGKLGVYKFTKER